ncbi:hypothetical protein [Pandoraea pneumonica]|uniref:hypothetical protein n=1 Tax=Pandoraea pneumonica TaxID=2508299 RepID=UPI003CF4F5FC
MATTPGGALASVGYQLLESTIGTVQALLSPDNYNRISGEMMSPGQLQRAKEDLAINAAALFVGPANEGIVQGVAVGRETGLITAPKSALTPYDTSLGDIVAQTGGAGNLRFARTEGLGTHATMAELRASGALPGEQGVIVTDRTVRFGDVYELGTLGGRKVEFSLVTERVDDQLVKKLYSGDAWTSPVPRDARLIGHVHPNESAFQVWPSTQDMNMVNARYFRSLIVNPSAAPQPTRIFWGPGNTDNTIFYPGFGKTPFSGKGG